MESLQSDILPLDSLPWELIGEITKYYDPKTLLAICATSSKYNKLCKDVRVWRNIFLDEGLDTSKLEAGLSVEDYIDLYWTDKNIHINTDMIMQNLRDGKYYDAPLEIDPEEQKWGIGFEVIDVIFNDNFNMQDISDIVYGNNKVENDIFLTNEARILQELENNDDDELLDQINIRYDDDTKRFFIHYDAEPFNDNKLYVSDDTVAKLIYTLLKNNIILYDVMGRNVLDNLLVIYNINM